MKRSAKAFLAAAIFGAILAPFGAAPARADHSTAYCGSTSGTMIPISTPAATFYFHDRARTPGTGLAPLDGVQEEHRGGTWLFMENGKQAGLQTGGEAVAGPLNDLGSDDPCTRQTNSDDVIF
jgi:hypothetical protein